MAKCCLCPPSNIFNDRAPRSFIYTREPHKVLEHNLLRLVVRILEALSNYPSEPEPLIPSNIIIYFSHLQHTAAREWPDHPNRAQAKDLHRLQELIGVLALVLFTAYAFSPRDLSAHIIAVVKATLPMENEFFLLLKVFPSFYFLSKLSVLLKSTRGVLQ